MSDYIQVVTTTERREDAERIARALVEERLAAWSQVTGPITSTYRWQGKIETAQEWQCWAKSRRDLYDRNRAGDSPAPSLRSPGNPGHADYWPAAPIIWHGWRGRRNRNDEIRMTKEDEIGDPNDEILGTFVLWASSFTSSLAFVIYFVRLPRGEDEQRPAGDQHKAQQVVPLQRLFQIEDREARRTPSA